MPISAHRAMLLRAISLALAGMTTLATVQGASAEDGLGGFLSSIFGGGAASQQAAAPASVPSYQKSDAPRSTYRSSYFRPSHSLHQAVLTVRLHRTAPKVGMAQVPTKPDKVSIFEDRTLKRGDVVMTADGIRVFAGSASWPYTKADFIGLAAVKDLNKDTARILAEVDRLPRG